MKRKKHKAGRVIGQFKGLYGDRSGSVEQGFLFSELLETRSKQFDWKIEPHFHPGLFQVFFVEEGTFDLYESGGKRIFMAPCVILIPPAALHGFDYGSQAKGRILSIADELLHHIFQDAEFLTPMLGSLNCITNFDHNYSVEQVKNSLMRLDEELVTNRTGKAIMLQACLQQLFVILFRLWEINKDTDTEHDLLNLGYFEKFQRLIRKTSSKTTVKALADKLAITPVHLNRICNRVAGKSAGGLMDERLLEEAKKYLSYSSYSVSEIAYLLQFDYPNYFARFFRKHTALSPSQFRKQLDGVHHLE